MTTDSRATQSVLDEALARCASEPIHTPGGIQTFGTLLAVSSGDDIVTHCAANVGDFLGRGADEIIGHPLAAALPQGTRIPTELPEGAVRHLGQIELPKVGLVELYVHQHAGVRFVELIRNDRSQGDPGTQPWHLEAALSDLTPLMEHDCDPKEFAQKLVEQARSLIGYDRVMTYRFDPEWNGEVIAEARAEPLEPFLGLCYPASDIPAQARDLYLRVRTRVLGDVCTDPVPVVGRDPTDGGKLDMSFALLRISSPIHREYLKNMGVRATVIVSIVVRGRLWGLIACHHMSPRTPTPATIQLLDVLARLLAAQVTLAEQGERMRGKAAAQRLLSLLPGALAQRLDFATCLIDPDLGLLELMNATGLSITQSGLVKSRGEVPSEAFVQRLATWLEARGDPMFATDRLGEVESGLAGEEHAAGVLALRVPDVPYGWILWFRPELSQSVRWGGDPRKRVVHEGGFSRLSPRGSFTLWLSEVRGRAAPWTVAQIANVEDVIRPNLFEVLAKSFRRQAGEFSYRAILFEQVSDAVVVTDLNGIVTLWNAGAKRALGWSSEEMLGRPLIDRLPPNDRADAAHRLTRAIDGEEFAGVVAETHRDGHRVWLDVHLRHVLDENGRPLAVMSVGRDVTAVRTSEDRFRAIFNAQFQFLGLMSPDGVLLEANRGALDLVGVKESEVLGKLFWETAWWTHDEAQRERVRESVRRAAAGEQIRFETFHYVVDGSLMWVDFSLTPFRDESGEVVLLIPEGRDITARRQTAQALKMSEERLSMALGNSQQGMWDWDVVTGQSYIDDQWLNILGYAPGEMPQRIETWERTVHPDDLPRVRELLGKHLLSDDTLYDVDYRSRTKLGEWVWINARGRVQERSADGRALRMIGTVQDITARKQIEDSLRNSEERLSIALGNSQQGLWDWDLPSGRVYLDDRWQQILGYNPGELPHRIETWEQTLHPEDRPGVVDILNQHLACDSTLYEVEYRARTKRGDWVWINARGRVQSRAADGTALRMTGTIQDISARKKIEEAVREQEERFRSAFDFAPIGMALVGLDGKWLKVNHSVCNLVDYTEAELLSIDFQTITHPGDLEADLHLVHQVLDGSIQTYQMDKRYFHKTGRVVETLLSVSLVRNGQGQPLYFVSQIKDISERKQAERALKANEALLCQFITHAPAAIAMLDTEMRYLQVSDRWRNDYHLVGQDLVGRSHYDVFPDIPNRWKEIHSRVLQGAVEGCSEDPFPREDGGMEWLQWEARPWHLPDGEIGGLIFFTQVITARKQAEEALRTSEERFRILFEHSSDAHLIFDEADGIIDCNNAAAEMLRCLDRTEVLSVHPAVLSPEFQPDGRRSLEKCIEMDALARQNGYHRFDWIHRRLDGELFPCEVTLTPVELAGRSVLMVVWHDLTDRKRAETALRESEERFRAAMEGSLHAVYFLLAERNQNGVITDFRFADINRRGAEMISRLREEVIGQRLCELMPINRTGGFFAKYVRVVETGESLEEEFAIPPADGLVASWLHHMVVKVGDGVAITSQDVTGRRMTEEDNRASEERYRSVVEALAEGIVVQNVEGSITASNRRACEILGMTEDQMAGRTSLDPTWEAIREDGSPFPGNEHPSMITLRTGKAVFDTIMGVQKPSGDKTWMMVNSVPIQSADGAGVRAVVASFHDITESRRLHEQVRASLREKEVLLQEIHHRVKNNLQIISTLLDLQSDYTTDVGALAMFQESRGRVKSMALIHERLYRSNDMARVNFAEYIRQLADDLYHTYKISDDVVRFELEVDIPPLSIDIAIPCGLILNELMSNCFKHAFTNISDGCLRVALHRDAEDHNVLIVADDGTGFPTNIDLHTTNSFGLQLVNTLVDQLDGTIQLVSERGTTFTIRFPNPKTESRRNRS